MKTIDRPKRNWLWFAGVLAALGALLASCDSNDEGGSPIDNSPVSPIKVEEIIASPKSADPGDTLLLSAIVTSTSPNESEAPTMAWTANGGAFLETNQTSGDVVLAVRPEDIAISTKPVKDAVEFTAYSVLPAGADTTIIAQRCDLTLTVRVSGISHIKMDDKIWLSFDASTINLYDKESGNLLTA